ncbi:nicotinate phosphoribosyltransferase [Poriferisphaera sp. WC338]|uniref:nicotinate phosphoribosyltransferase n=1 Tax=Poriferisphaera sp. WC338 TaxID=3425129 RepID=UPI003D81C0D4
MTGQGLYRHSLALLTDLYQLTMAYGYWKTRRLEQLACFNLMFRDNPFNGGYTVTAGLEEVIHFLNDLRFEEEDVAYLGKLMGADGKPLFEIGFLNYLQELEFCCDVDAMPEGTIAFPNEPMLRITGPILQCQILETALLNMMCYQTLIASKASRVCLATRGEEVLEFGLRRAQGIDGGLAASRAAYIGGCGATSNVLAGKLYGIPVKGTHAHSWVMSFDSELEAFEAYAEAMPNNCMFLVDTYDTLEGVRQAVAVGKKLRDKGHDLLGIRLDSGDLAYLSAEARKILDEGGFADAKIVASNDLDEFIIDSLKRQHAQVNVWGVGTKLATAFDQPALGGVFKLSAVKNPGEDWEYKVKLSEQTVKISTPGFLQVRRYQDKSGFIADMVYDEHLGAEEQPTIIDPNDATKRKRVSTNPPHEDLLVPIYRNGEQVYDIPSLSVIRQRVQDQLSALHPSIRRFLNPHTYPAGLEARLYDLRTKLILKARGYDENGL